MTVNRRTNILPMEAQTFLVNFYDGNDDDDGGGGGGGDNCFDDEIGNGRAVDAVSRASVNSDGSLVSRSDILSRISSTLSSHSS